MNSFLKKMGILVMALLMIATAISCGNDSNDALIEGNLAFYDLGDGTYGVGIAPDREATVETVVIPAMYQGMSVVKIMRNGFANCAKLKSVTIPEGLKQIDAFAFSKCESIASIVLPQSLTTVGNYAFSGCEALEGIVIPNAVTEVGAYAFSFCSALRSIELSQRLSVVEEYLFYNCEDLMSITVPNSVTAIEKYAFNNCTKLASVVVGSDVSEIGAYAFEGCASLAYFSVSEGNKTFCSVNGIMYDKPITKIVQLPSKLAGDIVIPNGVTAIKSSLFAGMDQITSITIPKSVTSIGGSAFKGCTALKEATFEVTAGWKTENVVIDATALSNPEIAASYLTDNYEYGSWKRSN